MLAFSALASSFADVQVDITGATAFRAAALESIKAKFVESGQPFKYAHDKAAGLFNSSTYSVFIGTFPGVSGTTTIRCSFNGSVEGIRAITQSPTHDPQYMLPSVLDATVATVGGAELPSTSSPRATSQSEFAFSDVAISSTPYGSYSVLPADAAVGVVVFSMIANESAPANLTNISSKQFQALFAAGYLPTKVLTGVNTDTGYVFATGRNDGSGTRTTYMAETGLGITTPVQQYVRGATSGDTITQIHRVPAGGLSGSIPGSSAANASTVWGQDLAGNGGYSSGSSLRDDMGRTSANCQVLDADGSELLAAGSEPVTIVSFLSLGDVPAAVTAGAKVLAYNGVKLDSIATPGGVLNATDKAKITEGSYTAWGYQQLYRRGDLAAGDAVTVYDGLKAAIPSNLSTAGIPMTDMHVGRTVDGGPVAP